jgi:hypothetical protein
MTTRKMTVLALVAAFAVTGIALASQGDAAAGAR